MIVMKGVMAGNKLKAALLVCRLSTLRRKFSEAHFLGYPISLKLTIK